MAGIIAAAGLVGEFLTLGKKEDLTALDIYKSLGSSKVKLLKTDGSMMRLLSNYVVEPVVVISTDLRDEEVTDKLLGLHVDMFTAFYAQAFDILRAEHGLSDGVIVDALTTDSGGVGRAVFKGIELTLDDRDFTSEMLDGRFEITSDAAKNPVMAAMLKAKDTIAEQSKKVDYLHGEIENRNKKLADTKRELAVVKAGKVVDSKNHDIAATRNNELTKDFTIPNAMQRTLDITIVNKRQSLADPKVMDTVTMTIPITIKLHVIFSNGDNIVNLLKPNSDDMNLFSRLDEYRSGAISFRELLFVGDALRSYRRNKVADKMGLMELINSRRVSANSKIVDNGFVGFEKFYTMYILGNADRAVVEKHLRGKLSKDKVKQKFLDQAFGLSITSVDTDRERIKIALSELRGTSDLSFKGAIKAGKGGSDVTEMVKALMANKPPIF